MWIRRLRCVVSLLVALTALTMLATGLLLKFVMPPGCRGGRGLELWGLGRHDWGDLHYLCSLALFGLAVAYVLMRTHPQSIPHESSNTGESTPRRPLTKVRCVSLAALAAVVVIGFLWAASAGLTHLPTGSHEGECTGEQRHAATQPNTGPAESMPACRRTSATKTSGVH